MDLDKALVSSIVYEGISAVRAARDRGIIPEFLTGEGQVVLEFVFSYFKAYNSVPTFGVIEGKTGVTLEIPTSPSDFFISEVIKRRLFFRLQTGLVEGLDALRTTDPSEALVGLEDVLKTTRKECFGINTKIEKIGVLAGDVVTLYDKLKAGERGILTPWETVNEETYGFWPQDLVIFVARLGKGKSWLAVYMAHHAWKIQNKHVLFATTEMSKIKIAQRFCAIEYKLPYDHLRKGRLGIHAEEKFKKGVESMLEADGFDVVGGDFDFRVDTFCAAVEEKSPDIVFLDGAYLLRVEGASRTEKAANAFDEIKRLAHRLKIPIVVTTQFNREVKGNSGNNLRVESIALTDVAGWNGDVIYGIIQSDEMKGEKKMELQPLKLREGPGIESVTLNWDFDTMDFSEKFVNNADSANDDLIGGGSSGKNNGGPLEDIKDVPF